MLPVCHLTSPPPPLKLPLHFNTNYISLFYPLFYPPYSYLVYHPCYWHPIARPQIVFAKDAFASKNQMFSNFGEILDFLSPDNQQNWVSEFTGCCWSEPVYSLRKWMKINIGISNRTMGEQTHVKLECQNFRKPHSNVWNENKLRYFSHGQQPKAGREIQAEINRMMNNDKEDP